MILGYARVSTIGQNLNAQIDALTAAGCERIYKETTSGAKNNRLELSKLIDILREGDILTVCRLDRLGRSTQHPVFLINELQTRGVQFRSLASVSIPQPRAGCWYSRYSPASPSSSVT